MIIDQWLADDQIGTDRPILCILFYIYITFMHLTDAFIQSDLLNIQD